MTQERVAYINGDYLPESEVKVSFRDRGFVLGDAYLIPRGHSRERFSDSMIISIVYTDH